MNWRRKCWEKCGGSGTEEGREEGGRERISFYAFKAVLSMKTTQNGLVKYCAEEGGRKEGKTKRSPHRTWVEEVLTGPKLATVKSDSCVAAWGF